MANTDAPGGDVRTRDARLAPGEQSIRKPPGGAKSDTGVLAEYSFSSPEFRRSVRQLSSGEHARVEKQQLAQVGPSLPLAVTPEVPGLLNSPKPAETVAMPEVPPLLRTPTASGAVEPAATPGPEKPKGTEGTAGTEQPVVPAILIAPAEQMEDRNKTVDPCTKKIVNALPAPAKMPKAMDSVREHDPNLFKEIQAKVTDPRYTGELGNITVATHDKNGRVNGCVFVQNVPYWESGPATQALVDVNKELAAKGKKLEADPLNGAGRTLSQEEAIVWRNSGLHARVGKSNHGFGKAEDFKPDQISDGKKQPWEDPFVNATLHAHGWRQGDSWGPLKNDLHHWSFVGPGPASDGHPPPRKPTHGSHHRHR